MVSQPGGGALPEGVKERIIAAADGNPLFLEEMIAMLRERGTLRDVGGSWQLEGTLATLEVPPSIQALLSARLDQLQGPERTLLQHGSVIGRTFEAAAVAAIGSDEVADRLAHVLMALVRRELLQPSRADVTGGDAYRFRHILIRDAAYQALAKADRARLHERFAAWLQDAAGARSGEYDEIVAHHLERAFRYREELGYGDLDDLRRSAAESALRAGRRALARDDSAAAITLLRSAVLLGRGLYETEIAALRTLSEELGHTSEFDERERLIVRALEIARESGDDREVARAMVNRLILHRSTEPASWVDETQRDGPEAIRMLEAAGDDAGLAGAWHAMALAAYPDTSAAAVASERALHHARLADDPHMLGWTLTNRPAELMNDGTPVAEAIRIVDGIADETRQLGRLFESNVGANRAVLEAMAGRYDDALALFEEARATMREFNYQSDLASSASRLTLVHELGGHLGRAEAPLREAVDFLESVGDLDLGPWLTAMLARCLAWQGRHEEAKALIAKAQVDDADPMREVFCRAASSHVLAAEGDLDGSVEEARRAVEGMRPEWPTRRGLILLDLAHALHAAGRSDEARAALDEARALAERKGNVALVALVERQPGWRAAPMAARVDVDDKEALHRTLDGP